MRSKYKYQYVLFLCKEYESCTKKLRRFVIMFTKFGDNNSANLHISVSITILRSMIVNLIIFRIIFLLTAFTDMYSCIRYLSVIYWLLLEIYNYGI